uniref:Uncharacterized protein n=1 Tax=Magallana gigas TaxID=29159 RepID=K1QNH3_MAGGI
MVGQLLYELFTHGCHPYTELYGHSLDRVLELESPSALGDITLEGFPVTSGQIFCYVALVAM